VRSLTVESNAVVDAIVDPKATNADRGAKFRGAAQVHSDLHTNPRVGQGLHRHLFALYLLILTSLSPSSATPRSSPT